MGIIKEGLKTIVSPKRLAAIGISYNMIEQYKKELKRKGEKMSWSNAYDFFGKPAIDKLTDMTSGAIEGYKNPEKKAMGGMATARKKNMGLKMAEGGIALKLVPSDKKGLKKLPKKVRKKMGYMKNGGSVKSSSKKSRGTGAAIKGTKFKGVF